MTKICKFCGFEIHLDIMGWYSVSDITDDDGKVIESVNLYTCINRNKHEPQ